MSFSQIEGFVFLFAAIVTAAEIPHGSYTIFQWLLHRFKPLSGQRCMYRFLWLLALATSLIVPPIHPIAFALEAKNHLSH